MFMTLVIVVFVFLMQFLWLYVDEIAGKGLDVSFIMEFIGWLAISNIPIAIPMAALFASLIVMGNLGENNELLALKASGVSLNRIFYPLYVAIAFIALANFYISTDVAPYSFLKMRSMFQDIRRTKPELSIPVGVFYQDIDNFSIKVEDKDKETGVLRKLMIYDHRDGEGNISVTLSDSGYIKQTDDSRYIIFQLLNGVVYEDKSLFNSTNRARVDKEKLPFHRRTFSQQTIHIDLGENTDGSSEFLFKDLPAAKSLKDLGITEDSLVLTKKNNLSNFEREYIVNTSTFENSREMDTSAYRRSALKYVLSTDSLFQSKSATDRSSLLESAIGSVERVTSYWNNTLEEAERLNKNISGVRLEWHRKFTLPLTCIVFFFIGAPLGAIIRKGGLGLPMVVSVSFFVIYYVIDSICKRMVQTEVLNPAVGAWLPFFLFLPIAGFLTFKSNTDSQLFNPDSYNKFFNQVFGRMKRLIEPLNLDIIKTLSEQEQEIISEHYLSDSMIFKSSIDDFIQTYKINKNFVSLNLIGGKEYENALFEFKKQYFLQIQFLSGIYNNENLRNLLKDMPTFNVDEFLIKYNFLPESIKYSFLGTFIVGLTNFRRRRKLKYTLEKIAENIDLISKIYKHD